MSIWEDIDDFLNRVYNPCDYKSTNHGMVRLSVDGEGQNRLVKDLVSELEEVSFDMTADVQWFHTLGPLLRANGTFGDVLTQNVEVVFAEKAHLRLWPDFRSILFSPSILFGSTLTGPQYAQRWLLSREDQPNEWRFGVTSYSFSQLTNYA